MKLTILQFCLSSVPVFFVRGAYIMRKNLAHAETIDLEIMWLHALGISNVQVEDVIKQNNGIWASDSGTCKESRMTEVCSLPSGSEFYSWGKKNKEKT